MPRTVAIVLPSYAPIGVVRAMFRLASGLCADGVTVDLVVLGGPDQPPFVRPEGVRLTHLGAVDPEPAAAKLAAFLRAHGPDATLAASSPSALCAMQARHLSKVRTRLVISMRTQLSALWQLEMGGVPQTMLAQMRAVFPRADALVAVSGGVADDLAQLLQMPRERLRVVYNGIDVPDCLRRAEQPVAHPGLDAAGGPSLLLGVGRLGPQKDFPTLLRAFALLRAQRPARLMILGDGDDMRALRALAQALGLGADVDLPGFVADPLPYMRRAGVFVLSSSFEGMPNVLLEALAVGTPVVSTDCPSGPHELLGGGKYGALVPVGDAHALAHAIRQTLDDPPPRERLVQRARTFSMERMVAGYLDVLFG